MQILNLFADPLPVPRSLHVREGSSGVTFCDRFPSPNGSNPQVKLVDIV